MSPCLVARPNAAARVCDILFFFVAPKRELQSLWGTDFLHNTHNRQICSLSHNQHQFHGMHVHIATETYMRTRIRPPNTRPCFWRAEAMFYVKHCWKSAAAYRGGCAPVRALTPPPSYIVKQTSLCQRRSARLNRGRSRGLYGVPARAQPPRKSSRGRREVPPCRVTMLIFVISIKHVIFTQTF
jgi:hypothetical protein